MTNLKRKLDEMTELLWSAELMLDPTAPAVIPIARARGIAQELAAEANLDKLGLPQFAGKEGVTPRELQVLALLVQGASSKLVGEALGNSPRTIEVHRHSLLEKLGARNAAHLTSIVWGMPPPANAPVEGATPVRRIAAEAAPTDRAAA